MPRRSKHIKRPMNAFMLWAKDNRAMFIERHPELHNADISRLLGGAWTTRVTDETKRYYAEKAKQVAEEHRRKYPDYKYQPQRKGESKQKTAGEVLRNADKYAEYGVTVGMDPIPKTEEEYDSGLSSCEPSPKQCKTRAKNKTKTKAKPSTSKVGRRAQKPQRARRRVCFADTTTSDQDEEELEEQQAVEEVKSIAAGRHLPVRRVQTRRSTACVPEPGDWGMPLDGDFLMDSKDSMSSMEGEDAGLTLAKNTRGKQGVATHSRHHPAHEACLRFDLRVRTRSLKGLEALLGSDDDIDVGDDEDDDDYDPHKDIIGAYFP
ncbi:sex determining protein [Salpingoeca rosetta]|uniref:Sex determining protein n=1 Tax=Salpingoeca rosetta (strain ATCC 50818 / BSB-021) TaxID=946362 RepID=F2U2M7_SALR5|nr:sex determining protein [Salpingoeca rosetta]EGD81382.1 sex determining protein [Salpingoeca rosetta]|eukprot:XP_004996586.1 sex determining protein [Salpingoeca rosetta]